jgi:hypothetical protein
MPVLELLASRAERRANEDRRALIGSRRDLQAT